MEKQRTIHRDRAMLLVIDMQTKLLPHIHQAKKTLAASTALLEVAGIFDIPVMGTVQYVKGLGETDPALTKLCNKLGAGFIEKMSFSVCRDDSCRNHIESLGRNEIIITGIEGHVCVQQTVMDLMAMNLHPVVCADAVSSRRLSDLEPALKRMEQAGATVTTTESVAFELCEFSGTPEFKELLGAIKRFDQARE